jgi:hypothetical protein
MRKYACPLSLPLFLGVFEQRGDLVGVVGNVKI